MGCVFGRFRASSINEDEIRTIATTPSSRFPNAGEKLVAIDPKSCVFDGVEGEVVFKTPGDICGADFVIRNCKDAKIYLLDHTAAITIDDCFDSHLFIGPCSGSIFLRDCSGCVLMVSCQQFRARDCKDCVVYLHCNTQPIIESCCRMSFGCFQFSYPQLKDQIHLAGLSVFNNYWMSVHDFTPEDLDNWKIIDQSGHSPCLIFSSEADSDLEKLGVSLREEDSVVPVTVGGREGMDGTESCLVIFFNSANMSERALEFVNLLHGKAKIVLTSEKNIKNTILASHFDKHPNPPSSLSFGCTIFIEVQGRGCICLCQNLIDRDPDNSKRVYVSSTPQQAIADIDYFNRNLLERDFTM